MNRKEFDKLYDGKLVLYFCEYYKNKFKYEIQLPTFNSYTVILIYDESDCIYRANHTGTTIYYSHNVETFEINEKERKILISC